MLPVSLDCFCFVCPVSCVHHVATFSSLFLFCLSSSCVPFVAIFFGLFFKQNKNNPEKLATWCTQDEEKQNKNNPEKVAT
jgi:hypothetical protein